MVKNWAKDILHRIWIFVLLQFDELFFIIRVLDKKFRKSQNLIDYEKYMYENSYANS
jgi:hypothetical protein